MQFCSDEIVDKAVVYSNHLTILRNDPGKRSSFQAVAQNDEINLKWEKYRIHTFIKSFIPSQG